jgi:hypothetical protein
MPARPPVARCQEWRAPAIFFAHVPVRILDLNRGIIYQNADSKRHAAQRHDIDGLSERVKHRQRRSDRQWYRRTNNQGGTPGTEEEQDH